MQEKSLSNSVIKYEEYFSRRNPPEVKDPYAR